nr:MAG TPA: hypothetical protein [Caudoviricetes sp.]
MPFAISRIVFFCLRTSADFRPPFLPRSLASSLVRTGTKFSVPGCSDATFSVDFSAFFLATTRSPPFLHTKMEPI